MSLYIVYRKNPFFPNNTYIESFEDGCQEAVVEQQGNRLKIISNRGIVYPYKTLAPFMIRVQSRGLAKRVIA